MKDVVLLKVIIMNKQGTIDTFINVSHEFYNKVSNNGKLVIIAKDSRIDTELLIELGNRACILTGIDNNKLDDKYEFCMAYLYDLQYNPGHTEVYAAGPYTSPTELYESMEFIKSQLIRLGFENDINWNETYYNAYKEIEDDRRMMYSTIYLTWK